MAFGQQGGPPASSKQIAYLLSLVQGAGHDGFRDARHPLGLTQRQAGGKFTTREASELIDRLLAGDTGDGDTGDGDTGAGGGRTDAAAERARARLDAQRGELLAGIPADDLVAELERRGWTCVAPT